jgi:hypothetical protein
VRASETAHAQRPAQRLIGAIGAAGAALGVAAGLAELTLGPSIRSWVGNKQDTTRLGLATLLLAALAVLAALALRRPGASPPARLAAAIGLLVPGLICFTTVGRLWYLPGAILVPAGAAALADLRKDTKTVRAALDRNWAAILTAVLALFYVFLGATALGLAGVLGIVGGVAVLAALELRRRLPHAVGLAILTVATLPFALLTWWSVAVPLIGILLIATGSPALRSPTHCPSTAPSTSGRRDLADSPQDLH